jgi:cell division protein FtsI (penicillin-binding protein 3)
MDRNGEVMATSLPVRAIEASPDDVQASTEQLQELATLLGIGYGELKKKLDSDRNFVYLKHQVEPELAKRVLDLNIPGIRTSKEYKRSYPAGPAAAHLLGFTDFQDVGKEGIEYIQQKSLAGVTGSRRVIRDRQGRVVEDVAHLREPRDGKNSISRLYTIAASGR